MENQSFRDYSKTLKYLNPAAFALVPINPVSRITVRPGNVGNNAIREPGAWNVNFGLSKEFSVTERARFRIGHAGLQLLQPHQPQRIGDEHQQRLLRQVQNTPGARQIQLNGRVIWELPVNCIERNWLGMSHIWLLE